MALYVTSTLVVKSTLVQRINNIVFVVQKKTTNTNEESVFYYQKFENVVDFKTKYFFNNLFKTHCSCYLMII